jgi:hypothetical protein
MKTLRILVATAALLTGPALAAWATPASASGGGSAVTRTGNCSGAADWKLKARARDGGFEVEFEVDTNRNGQAWNYTLRRNGAVVAQGTATTRAPSGSFSIERRTGDAAGQDTFVGTATNPRSGQTCRGTLTV